MSHQQEFENAIEAFQQEAQNERYANILSALKECIEKRVSHDSMKTLRFETGVEFRDYVFLQDAVIAKLKSEIGELDEPS